MKTAVLRVKKLSSMTAIRGSGQHTWREIPTHNADAERTSLNEDWRDVSSSTQLLDAVKSRLNAVTESASADPVLCVEYLITAHQDAFNPDKGGITNPERYFEESLAWLEEKHGKENIVAVNIQNDESAPHMVAYVVPIVEVAEGVRKRSVIAGRNEDGTLRRETREYKTKASTRLSAYHYFGSPKKLSDMQSDFALKVGSNNYLKRGIKGSKAKHVRIKDYYRNLNKKHEFELKAKDLVRQKTGLLSKETDEQRLNRLLEKLNEDLKPLKDTAQAYKILKDKHEKLEDKLTDYESLEYELRSQKAHLDSITGGLSHEQKQALLDYAQNLRDLNLNNQPEQTKKSDPKPEPEPSPKPENHDIDLGF